MSLLAAALIAVAVVAVAASHCILAKRIDKLQKPQRQSQIKAEALNLLVEELAFSIETEPDAWNQPDKYHFTHRSGLELWVGNEAYGMQVYEPMKINEFTDGQKQRLWEVFVGHGNSGCKEFSDRRISSARKLLLGSK